MGVITESKLKTYTFVAFNIRLHPHEKEGVYIDFFKFLQKSKLFSHTGYKYNVIGVDKQRFESYDKSNNAFLGRFIRYTNIYDAKWFNTDKDEVELKEDLRDLIQVPDHLKLDGTVFDFFFLLQPHILIVQIDNEETATTANTVQKYFKKIFKSPEFIKEFKEGEITTICQSKDVQTLLENPRLKFIEYIIRRPNADLFGDLIEAEVLAEMEESNADEYRFQMEAQNGKFLNLSDRVKDIGEISADNGEVNALELPYDSSRYKKISTKAIPLQEPIPLLTSLTNTEKWKKVLLFLKPKVKRLSQIVP
ncbi:hypothetical protein D3C80_395390 [compost metagenome]